MAAEVLVRDGLNARLNAMGVLSIRVVRDVQEFERLHAACSTLFAEITLAFKEKFPELDERTSAVTDGILIVLGHLRVSFASAFVRFKDGIPAKVKRSAGKNYLAICSSLKYMNFCVRPRSERHNRLRVRQAIVKSIEHPVLSIVAALFQKVSDVRTGHAIKCIETKRRVFRENRSVNRLCFPSALIFGDIHCFALKLWKIHVAPDFPSNTMLETPDETPGKVVVEGSYFTFTRSERKAEEEKVEYK